MVGEQRRLANEARPDVRVILAEGVQALRAIRRLQRLLLLSLAAYPLVNYLLILYQPHFVRVGVPGIWFGLALAIGSLLAALGERSAAGIERRLGTDRALLVVTVAPGALYLLTPLLAQPAPAVALFCMQYGVAAIRRPLFVAAFNAQLANRSRATALSLINMAESLYVALVGLLIGGVADRSLMVAYLLMGGLIVLGALLLRTAPTFTL
jgi:hypothetical protein